MPKLDISSEIPNYILLEETDSHGRYWTLTTL